ncbi:MAG: ABC transporter permease, partial [Nitrospirae bacterium]|nr:ABC transporter permease [Nitrospirota bacterium]
KAVDSSLASKSVGDKVVVTAAMANTGNLSQEMFRVGGIFKIGSKMIDNGFAFINIDKSRTLLGIDGNIHEIALKFKDINDSGDLTIDFWNKYSKNGNEAIGWRDLIPQISAMFGMLKYQKVIMCTIIFSIVGLLIMNTLFMSLYERMYEFGVLRAIGTKPINLASMIVLEACVLAAISIIIGVILGFSFSYYYSVHGLNLSGTEFGGATFTEPLYAVMQVSQYFLNPMYVFIFSIVAAIYPAFYAARLTPAKAMKRSM